MPGARSSTAAIDSIFVVRGELIVEIKAVERVLPVHEAQLIRCLKRTGIRTGLLVNFHTETLRRDD